MAGGRGMVTTFATGAALAVVGGAAAGGGVAAGAAAVRAAAVIALAAAAVLGGKMAGAVMALACIVVVCSSKNRVGQCATFAGRGIMARVISKANVFLHYLQNNFEPVASACKSALLNAARAHVAYNVPKTCYKGKLCKIIFT